MDLEQAENKLNKRTVLVVDDDARNIFALVSYLDSIGVTAVTAENGIEALEVLGTANSIELVLMDMMMPEMDGYETIGRIQQNDKTKALPIIAVTAKAMVGDKEKCLAAGAIDYVSKPIDLAELVIKMAQVI